MCRCSIKPKEMALDCGLDVIALQREYGCAYASVTIRLAEVLWHLPLMALLYDRNERGDPAVWTEELELRARVVKRTRGLGSPPSRLLCGDRGGIPAWDRLLPPMLPGGDGRTDRRG